ncbi:DUF2490 domain-containing protein [Sunxiuqinia sp. sy24]|uniref:DUF2490 domain-containing protein n=1 Tax=Sunxiuqinia sp. sy24 TaxID=3461495 RepID=UPI004046210A
MYKSLIVFLLFLLSCQSLFAQEERDFYVWQTTSASLKMNELYSFNMKAKVHYRINDQFRDFTYFDLAVSRRMNQWLNLGLAFRGAEIGKESGNILEYRPQLVTGVHFKFGKVNCKSTNRLEYRAFSKGKAHFRYYHNIFIHFPSFHGCPRPYVGEELFTKLNDERLYLARVYGGLHLLEFDLFKVDAYYVWQELKRSGQWSPADILGLNLKFSI